jgi:putative transposase
MARPLRSNRVDGWYHVYHRGIRGGAVYGDDRDKAHFVDLLEEVHERFRVRIHAYCLMDTHWHGVLQTPDANLSQAMQWLHMSHAAYLNARQGLDGPLWRGRFGSKPIESSAWAYSVSFYVHLNPVHTQAFGLGKRMNKAEGLGLSAPTPEEASRRLKALRTYPWSSYRVYAGYRKGPKWLESATLLKRACGDPDAWHARYREDAQNLLRRGVDETRDERLRDAVAIGSERFVRQIKSLAKGGVRETALKRELEPCSTGDWHWAPS